MRENWNVSFRVLYRRSADWSHLGQIKTRFLFSGIIEFCHTVTQRTNLEPKFVDHFNLGAINVKVSATFRLDWPGRIGMSCSQTLKYRSTGDRNRGGKTPMGEKSTRILSIWMTHTTSFYSKVPLFKLGCHKGGSREPATLVNCWSRSLD